MSRENSLSTQLAPGDGVRSAAGVREAMREEIVSGRLGPGDRLPTHVELAEHFGVSNVTIQNALNQLAGDGFIKVRPRVGSFVVDHPPHVRNIALVFPFDPAAPPERWNWSRYYQTLTMAAREVPSDLGRRLIPFHGVDFHSESEDRRELLQHIERRRLAGIIFANPSDVLENTPIVDAPGLARVELSHSGSAPWPVINLQAEQWVAMALDRLAESGRRRPAVLLHRFAGNRFYQKKVFDQALARREMLCPTCWRQALDWHDSQAANHCVQLLMRGAAGERPDGILVTDDNLMDGVTAGLVSAGVRVPEDVEVVVRANFPPPSEPSLPFRMLGYDLREVLRRAVELIDLQRQEGSAPRVEDFLPVWREPVQS
jgi:DNA-binding LacI/PurR family transcriptional regulator